MYFTLVPLTVQWTARSPNFGARAVVLDFAATSVNTAHGWTEMLWRSACHRDSWDSRVRGAQPEPVIDRPGTSDVTRGRRRRVRSVKYWRAESVPQSSSCTSCTWFAAMVYCVCVLSRRENKREKTFCRKRKKRTVGTTARGFAQNDDRLSRATT